MKKKLSLLFALMLSTLMVRAYDAQIDGIYYNLITKAKQAEVTYGNTKYSGNVRIPESVTYNGVTYSVTIIRGGAFSSCSGLKSIEIPNSVTSIEGSAFSGCSGLTSVTVPNSATSIGEVAFSRCSSLTSVTIGNSVKTIEKGAFEGCSGLTKVNISDLEAWCKIKFSSSSSVNALDISSNPLFYAHHLFMDNKEITDLIIPDGITKIENWAFSGCSGLTSITIPNSVTSIGRDAFYGCKGLTSVIIPNSVTSIGERAFYICSGLTSVTIPNSVTSIGNSAFEQCYNLTSATMGNSVTSIGVGAFGDCSGLTSVTIPNSVTSIRERAFANCSGLTSVTIPNSVTSIGEWAFSGCSGLTSVTIPNSVTSIGRSAFSGCSGLTSITIPNSVTSIRERAFANCSELTDVYCYAENVPYAYSDAFQESFIEYATIYVPESSVIAYKAASPWSGFGTIKTLSGEIPETLKCATPTITISNGKLHFACETDDVEYVCKITPPSAITYNSNDINIPTKYTITVYATKDGYENSDVATKDINVGGGASGLRGDVNNDGTVNMPDAMFIVNKILNGKFPDE